MHLQQVDNLHVTLSESLKKELQFIKYPKYLSTLETDGGVSSDCFRKSLFKNVRVILPGCPIYVRKTGSPWNTEINLGTTG